MQCHRQYCTKIIYHQHWFSPVLVQIKLQLLAIWLVSLSLQFASLKLSVLWILLHPSAIQFETIDLWNRFDNFYEYCEALNMTENSRPRTRLVTGIIAAVCDHARSLGVVDSDPRLSNHSHLHFKDSRRKLFIFEPTDNHNQVRNLVSFKM